MDAREDKIGWVKLSLAVMINVDCPPQLTLLEIYWLCFLTPQESLIVCEYKVIKWLES